MTRTLEKSLAWAADGAAHLRGMMMRMGDDAFAAPSALPDWTRAHVLSHVARNADALGNLIGWARTGTPNPGYASREQRDADIASGAKRPAAEVRDDVIASSDRLAVVVRETPAEAWTAMITDLRGRPIRASEILWLRAREVWIHSVDLDTGASFTDFPRPMLHELLTDVASQLAAREDFPRLLLVPTDEPRTWAIGEGDQALEVRGPVAELAAWLLGRSKGRDLRTAEGTRPKPLPAWM